MWNPAIVALAMCLAWTNSVNCQEVESELELGKAINIFMRYGYLSICMRVVPRNDSENWVFREPTVNVFKGIEYFKEPIKDLRPKHNIFDGDFHLEFCDNLKQLLQAYFRDFSFEKLDKPWRAFTAGWPVDVMARNLGINSSFIASGDHCYVLVRVARYREKAILRDLPPNIEVEDAVMEAIARSDDDDPGSIADFIKKYGTHYIASYVTGNALYQVFVYSKTVYNRIKDRLKTKGISSTSNFELSSYFSPWYAEHVGQIKVASGNKTVENWASRKLRVHYYIFTYPSLMKLHSEPNLLKVLDHMLKNEAMLQLSLKTLVPAFKDERKRMWFEEMIDNYLKLWENNM